MLYLHGRKINSDRIMLKLAQSAFSSYLQHDRLKITEARITKLGMHQDLLAH